MYFLLKAERNMAVLSSSHRRTTLTAKYLHRTLVEK